MTPTQICSNALILLGEQSITSFVDGSVGSDVAGTLFASTYQTALTETRWHFATKTANLSPLLEKPENYTAKYTIPSDSLVVNSCSSNPYEIFEEELYTNCNGVIQVEYIFEPELDACPNYFTQALEYQLAAKFAIPISNDLAKADYFEQLSARQIAKARFLDASSRTNQGITSSPYVEARR